MLPLLWKECFYYFRMYKSTQNDRLGILSGMLSRFIEQPNEKGKNGRSLGNIGSTFLIVCNFFQASHGPRSEVRIYIDLGA